MEKALFVVQTNAVPGRDEEFNDWYDNQHLADLLEVPGFVAAQRFRLEDVPRDPPVAPYRYRYLAIYEIEGDPDVALAALSRARTGWVLSEAMEEDRQAFVFTPVTERVVRASATRSTATS